MIISIRKSDIFTKDPAVRFAREYAVPKDVWNELWRKYKLLDYSKADLRDFLFIKHARNLHPTTINRWITRGEVYMIAQPLIKKGVQNVNTEIFREYEEFLINELVKSLKYGATNKPESVL